MLELMTVLAITIIISVVTFVSLYQRRNQGDISDTAQEMVALTQQAQSRAMTDESSTAWGIQFDNKASASTSFYALFSGVTYSASATAAYYPLPADVCYANILSGSSSTVVFSPLSGLPSASASVMLQNVAKGCTSSSTSGASTLSVSSQGVVTLQ